MVVITIKRSGDRWVAERGDNGNCVGYSDDKDKLYHELNELRKGYSFSLKVED